ncbi:MAG: hypothetical protein COW16_04065 [Sphingomonadales bacterium CG12_big_fil_rev_8_21_14_0_65_65_10]|nr:MAG: hypothetical protein COW16_04065 [Sphingomonadales bacterium CG12_big_fil_rev_8_21_14_0_65_65_10]
MSSAAISGDRPLEAGGIDRLGFSEVASRISASLVDHASDKGLVVGLDGEWGSGKSSLLFLIEKALKELPESQRPSIINFRPWVIGNRDTLLASLFAALSDEMNRVELAAGDATGISKQKVKEAAEALRKFVGGLGKTGATIELLGNTVAFAPLAWLGKAITAIGNVFKDKPPDPPLSELKERLVKALDELGHRFIITIDDVDRLEPAEAVEVLRLARSVADFPNVTYLLCFDGEVLAHSVKQAAGIKNGRAYLEKIVQLSVLVPMPETFRLRQWFTDELRSLGSTKNDDELARLKAVIDFEGGRQLTTPRSVVRVLDSIRFFWPALKAAGGDLADLVWIQLIKVGNPDLYRWIEDYCATAAMISLGTVRVEEAARKAKLDALTASVKEGHFADPVYRYYFANPLPGADSDFTEDGNGFDLFRKVSTAERDEAIRGRRLASPDHYRLYFALTGPEHALSQANLDDFWQAADSSSEEVGDVILSLHLEIIPGDIGKADLLLERLKGVEQKMLPAERSQNILVAFSKVMDEAHRQREFERDWGKSLWDHALDLVPKCLSVLSKEARPAVLQTMFKDGEAISWLTSLMRRETFAHGRYGDRTKPDIEWLVTDDELDSIFDLMLNRFRSMSAEDVLSTISPLNLLFAWRQAGDEEGPRALIEEHSATSAGLIEALTGMTSIRTSSDRGSYSVLTRENVGGFLDFDAARAKISELAASDGPLAQTATALKQAFGDDSF